MEPQNKLQKTLGISLGLIIVIAIVYITVFAEKKLGDNSNDTQTKTTTQTEPLYSPETTKETNTAPVDTAIQTPPPVDTNKNQTPTQVSSSYKDGTYSAVGTYMSPGGQDQINVTATLSKDVIVDVSTTIKSADGTSTRYINKFISGYKDLVVGKNIADVNLSKVSGSSLTPKGFNNALEKIKAEAKV